MTFGLWFPSKAAQSATIGILLFCNVPVLTRSLLPLSGCPVSRDIEEHVHVAHSGGVQSASHDEVNSFQVGAKCGASPDRHHLNSVPLLRSHKPPLDLPEIGMWHQVTSSRMTETGVPLWDLNMRDRRGYRGYFDADLNATDGWGRGASWRNAPLKTTARAQLPVQSCAPHLLGPQRPVDVTSQVTMTMSGVRLNRATRRFVGAATVKNNSAHLPGPVSLVIELAGSVRMFNADGVTCANDPAGRPFVNLPLENDMLLAGATVLTTLEFENPQNEPVRVTAKVLAGPGAR